MSCIILPLLVVRLTSNITTEKDFDGLELATERPIGRAYAS